MRARGTQLGHTFDFNRFLVPRHPAINVLRRETPQPPSGFEPETCGLQNRS